MNKSPIRFLALAVLAVTSVAASDEPRTWPDLDDFGFVAGRAATKADFEEGRAVFLLRSDEESAGIPLEIEIPQCAYHTNSKTNERTAVVIVQAEEDDAYDIVCRKYRPIGSQVLQRKCKANPYWRAFEEAGGKRSDNLDPQSRFKLKEA